MSDETWGDHMLEVFERLKDPEISLKEAVSYAWEVLERVAQGMPTGAVEGHAAMALRDDDGRSLMLMREVDFVALRDAAGFRRAATVKEMLREIQIDKEYIDDQGEDEPI